MTDKTSGGEKVKNKESESNSGQNKKTVPRVMALAGNIEPFLPGTDFESYEDRISQFFIVNDVADEKKTALFITISGEAMYDIMKSLTHPDKPSTKSYTEISKLLKKHFTPQRNKRAERYKFYKATQETGESLSEYIVRLKSLSKTCEFGDFFDGEQGANIATYKLKVLDEALVDKFINGLRHEKIKQMLFNDDTLDFEKCCQKALQFEMVEKESKSDKSLSSVNSVRGNENRSRSSGRQKGSGSSKTNKQWRNRSQSQSRGVKHQCQRCGRIHDEKTCPAREWKCFSCEKVGHISTMCKSKPNGGKDTSKSNSHSNGSIKTIQYDNHDSGNYVKQIRYENFGGTEDNSQDEYSRESDDQVSDYLQCDTDEDLESVKELELRNESEQLIKAINIIHGEKRSRALEYDVDIERKKVNMESDTGAVVSIISLQEFNEKFCDVPLIKETLRTDNNLCTISGENLTYYGKAKVMVKFCGLVRCLDLIVVDLSRKFVALMGRNWLDVFFPLWREQLSPKEQSNINLVSTTNELLKDIKSKFPKVVSKEIDTPIEGYTADLVLKENSNPIFYSAYTVPYKLKEKVSEEIDRMCRENVFKPIKYSKWASPLVVRVKSNSALRFCLDGKVTINKFLETEHYPLPRIDDIFACLSNCKVFCVIDLKGAFKQLSVSKNSQELLTINTHKGLYACTRLMDGVASAPAIFQSVMDRILLGIEGVKCFIDDIIIGGKDAEECKKRLYEVLSRLNKHNVRINLEKCKFLESSVKYLGHIIENNELHPNRDKVKAILDAPAPKNVAQLQSYLGLLNYYGKFIPNLSSEIHDLYELLQEDKEFVWSEKCQKSFDKSKHLLTTNQVLELYDPQKPIVVAADASPYGVGAVLSHIVNGVEKPVLFASSTLSPAEKNYSQPHREALAVIFAVKKFFKYIYGQKFLLVSDHQSLREIFSPKKSTPAVAAARLQRWAVIMSMYDYEIVHRSATKMCHVDALSRLPLDESTDIEPDRINFMNFGEDLPIDLKDIQEGTSLDPKVSQVYKYVLNGWPPKVSQELMPFYQKRRSLSTEDNCLFYVNRIVVPEVLRDSVIKRLHECHTGIVRMKMMARSYVWWPLIDQDIEHFVGNCLSCQQTQPVKNNPTTSSWPKTQYPFQRIHIDFFKFSGKNVLLISDAHTKYCEAYLMSSTNLEKVTEKLINFFCTFGLPTELVSDNGPPFQAYGFRTFCEKHKIKLTHSPPWHPQSNGQAERAVRTIKEVFFKFCLGIEENLSMIRKIQKFVMYHNNSPSTTTGKTPSDIIFSFKPKTLLDLVNAKPKESIDLTSTINELNNSSKSKPKFQVNQNVLYLNHFKSHIKWIPATVVQNISLFTYLIKVYGRIRYVHENQIKVSKLSDIHHNPQQIILLPSPEKPILKNKNVNSPVDKINSDDECNTRVKFDCNFSKRRSKSLSETVNENPQPKRP